MFKKYKYLSLMIIGIYSSAFAIDVQVQVIGTVLAQSCNIKSSDLIKNVIFEDINPVNFGTIGATSESHEVNIGLENCTGNVNQLSYMFSGEPDENNPNLLKVTGKSGNSPENLATGIAVEILDMNKNPIRINQKQKFNKTIATPIYDFKFHLRYKSTNTRVGAGDASSLLYLDIYYE